MERAAGRHESTKAGKHKQEHTVKTRDFSSSSNPAFTLACPSCGKEFTDVTEEKAFRRLDRHCRASKEKDEYPDHGKSLDPSRIGLDSAVTTPDFIPTPRPWEEPEEEYDEDMGYEDHEEPEQDAYGDIPDPFVDLKRELMKYGLGPKRAIQFCSLMQHKNIHDIGDLYEVATDRMGWRVDQRNMFLETWANARSLPIPNWVADEIEVDYYPKRGHSPRRSRGFGGDDGVASALDKFTDTITSMQDAMMQQNEIHHREREGDRNREHALEIRMREELDIEKGRRYEQQIEHMQNLTQLQMQAMNLSGEQAAWSQISKSLDRIGSTSAMTMKWLITGIMEGEKAPHRERGEPGSVADMMYELDPEFVED